MYRMQAPQGSVEPYVVFQEQAGVDSYTFNARDARSLVYLVKAVDVGPSGLRAAQAAERIDALLTDKPLTAQSGWTQIPRLRESRCGIRRERQRQDLPALWARCSGWTCRV